MHWPGPGIGSCRYGPQIGAGAPRRDNDPSFPTPWPAMRRLRSSPAMWKHAVLYGTLLAAAALLLQWLDYQRLARTQPQVLGEVRHHQPRLAARRQVIRHAGQEAVQHAAVRVVHRMLDR